MPKRRDILEKLLALVLLAYGIGVLVGENLRGLGVPGKGGKNGVTTREFLTPAGVLEGFGGCEESGSSPVVPIFP